MRTKSVRLEMAASLLGGLAIMAIVFAPSFQARLGDLTPGPLVSGAQPFIVPFVVSLVAVLLMAACSRQFGIGQPISALLAITFLLGSGFNYPVVTITHALPPRVLEYDYFTFIQRGLTVTTNLGINFSGALLPLIISVILAFKAPKVPTLVTILCAASFAYLYSQVRPGEGVYLSPVVPAMAAASIAFLLAGKQAVRVAFFGGVVGTLVGADLMNLFAVMTLDTRQLSIGGGGIFDVVLVSGLEASFLTLLLFRITSWRFAEIAVERLVQSAGATRILTGYARAKLVVINQFALATGRFRLLLQKVIIGFGWRLEVWQLEGQAYLC